MSKVAESLLDYEYKIQEINNAIHLTITTKGTFVISYTVKFNKIFINKDKIDKVLAVINDKPIDFFFVPGHPIMINGLQFQYPSEKKGCVKLSHNQREYVWDKINTQYQIYAPTGIITEMLEEIKQYL